MGEHRMSKCPGCGAVLPDTDGPTHRYMTSSPACYAHFNALSAHEYSDAALMLVHRLTVDTFAIQHPGDQTTRQQIQSVGLHLARLGRQLQRKMGPAETNEVMLDLGKHKHTLVALTPPARFSMTVADVAPFAGTDRHAEKVRAWAEATWADWSAHHAHIEASVAKWQ